MHLLISFFFSARFYSLHVTSYGQCTPSAARFIEFYNRPCAARRNGNGKLTVRITNVVCHVETESFLFQFFFFSFSFLLHASN